MAIAIMLIQLFTRPVGEVESVPRDTLQSAESAILAPSEADTTIDVIAPAEEEPQEEAENPKDFYHLATMGDLIALFDEEGAVLEVYEIYVHILPPEDIKQLNVGIKIENEQHLRQLLEDFGG